jgi:nucleoid-associated protein YgaU
MPWTFVLVLVLLAILGAHNRIARDLGTAAGPAQGTVTALSTATSPPVSITAANPATGTQGAAPLPDRAPRDPFQALVAANGNRVAAVALPIGKAARAAATARSRASTHSATSGAAKGAAGSASHHSSSAASQGTSGARVAARGGSVHVVRAGESLWSIAQQHVNETGHGSVVKYWHRIYAANAHAIGANPSLLSIGLHLHLPSP